MRRRRPDTPPAQRAGREVRQYFVLTFLYSWVLWALAALSRRDADKPPAALLHVFGGIGPSLIGVVLTHSRGTAEERRDFWRRLIDPRRLTAPWYLAVAALTVGPTLLTKWMRRSPGGDVLDRGMASRILVGAPISSLSEELGWRGYALDRLQAKHSALVASLLLGTVWSLWHVPLFFIKGTYQHRLGILSREAPLFFALDLPRAVLATWIYNNTRRSVLGAVLLHTAENASMALTQGGRRERLLALSSLSALVVARWGPQTLTTSGMETGHAVTLDRRLQSKT